MKKKILFLLSFLILSMSILFVVPQFNVKAVSYTREIEINPRGEEKYAYADITGRTYFEISMDFAYDNDVYVYFETKNKSAVAELGDYMAKSSVAVIQKGKTSVIINIYAGRSEYAVIDVDGVAHSREFEVCITAVEGIENYVITKSSASGMIWYDYAYTAEERVDTGGHSLYFKEYENVDISPALSTPEIDGKGEESVHYDFSSTALYSHWKKKFIDKGLAKLYATYKGIIDDWGLYTYWSYVELFDSSDTLLVGIKSEGYYDNEKLNPNYYKHDGYDWYYNAYGLQRMVNHYHADLCCDCKKNIGDGYTGEFHSYFCELAAEPNYTIKFRTEGGRDREIHDVKIYSTLIDDKAPSVEGSTFYVNPLNRAGDTLRVAIRFDEPVYYTEDKNISGGDGTNPKITLLPNGDAAYPITLEYAGGSYTDTLFYEVDYEDIHYPHEKISSFELVNAYSEGETIHKVCDFAYRPKTIYKGGVVSQPNYTVSIHDEITETVSFDADLREPVIMFSCDTKSDAKKQHAVTVSVSNVDLDGSSLYYSFEDTNDTTGIDIKSKTYYGSALETNLILGGNYSGKRYLHVYVETKHQKSTYAVYDVALKFDNTAPITTVDSVTGNHKARTFTLTVKDEETQDVHAGLKEVYLYYKKDYDDEYTIKSIKSFSKGVYDSTFTYEVKATDLGVLEDDFSYVSLGFYATDRLGNKINVDFENDSTEYLFNTGNSFVSSFDSISGSDNHELTHFYDGDTILVVKDSENDLYLTFENEDYIDSLSELSPQIDYVYNVYNDKQITVSYENPTSNPTSIVVSLNPYDEFGNFAAGYYQIRFYIESLGEKYYSQVYNVYLSENGEYEYTPNYSELQTQYVLNNYVYQLSTKYPNYYYIDSTGALQKEPYATSSTPAAFSSYEKAFQYVYYKELLDLYGKKITALEANYLNGGSIGTHRKAENELTVAKEGQIWVRYKREKWDYIDQESSWVWYCYDDSTTNPDSFEIDTTIGVLPELLTNALTSVTKKITGNGQYVYLVGSDYTDKYGAPKLNPNQLHVYEEYYSFSYCGTSFVNEIVYPGDPDIIKSYVSYNDEERLLATNFTLIEEDYSIMFYRTAYSNDLLKKLNSVAGNTYGEAINANGLFEIVEAGIGGIRKYIVFIDRQAPFVQLSYIDTYGDHKESVLTQEHTGAYINAKSVTIENILMEVDDLSYILLYKASNLKLLEVITYESLQTKPVVLSNDHYVAHVYDRSGNFYVINFRTNDSDLSCTIKEQTNEYVLIETNRTANQIQYFEVYLDGELLTNVYSSSYKSTKSGSYQVNIKDWYGNVESIEYNFELDAPSVEWKYEIDGQVYNYDENSQGMKLQKLTDSEYFILSKGLLQFTLPSGYSFSFDGDAPDYSHSYINSRIRIKETVPFVLKIFYTSNPHIYVTYNVSFDETPPEIYASYIEREYVYEELKYFLDNISSYTQGDVLIPSSLDVSVDSSSFNRITNGQEFESDLINIEFADGSGIYNIKVYLDGELIKEIVYGDDINEITLSRKGEYRIVATDVLGNVNELSFVNKSVTSHSFVLDNDDKTSSGKYLYGKESLDVTLKENGEVSYLIKEEDKNHFVTFIFKDGAIYKSYYYVGKDQNLNSTVYIDDTTLLFEISELTKPNVYYDLVSDGFNFKVMYDANNNFKINATLIEKGTYDFECRVAADNDAPLIYKGSLSNELPDVVLKDYLGNNVVTNQEEKYIYISKEFAIDESQIGDEIEYINVYYSTGDGNESYVCVYEDGIYKGSKFVEDGFYNIEIISVYGNVTTYKIAMSNTFITTSKAIDNHQNEISYSKDFNKTVYSNNSVVISAYSTNVTCEVSKDEKTFRPNIEIIDGITVIILDLQGNYVVTLTDEYGNKKQISAKIKYTSLTFDENLIYGYSSGAKANHTNEKLSINHSLFDKYGIVYVSVIYQEQENIIYDLINESTVEFDEKAFEDCVGYDNTNGEYKVIFKDQYGNQLSKTIYYSDIPTIELSRKIRSNEESTFDINDVLEEGIWSNNSIRFDSNSNDYVFKVNGETCHLPYTLSFDNNSIDSEVKYEIYYSDEFGFIYNFDAHLYVKDIEIKVLNEDITLLGDLNTVKSNIKLSVEDNVVVTYTIDGSKEYVYCGEELIKDGVYRIEATDIAGNKNAITIKKDSYVYYEFYNVGKNQPIINGEVVNSNQVNFVVKNNDTSYIEKAFLNGVLLEDFDKTIFSEHGKWEFILSDKMGNKSYFSFYQVLKEMQEFDYQTPDYYKISEIQYDSGNGINISYMDYVTQNDKSSEISFKENGTYKVKITSIYNNSSKTFEIKINNIAPVITLIGCEEGGSTKEDVIIQGYSVGDTVYIYRDGKLVSKTYISNKSTTPQTIKDGGEYEVVIESEAGVKTSVKFKKDYIANTAGSVLIIIVILGLVICLFAGLLMRNKLKVDN